MIKRILIIMALVAVFIYFAILLIFFFAQKSLIYPVPADKLRDCQMPEGVEQWQQSSPDSDIHGIFTPNAGKKLLIFFHGNGETSCSWRYLGVNHASPLGYDTLIMEYPGYGGTSGEPSMASNQKMVEALANWLTKTDITYDKTVVMGYSLGTGIASMLAEKTNPDALILFAPYDRMSNVVHDHAAFIPRFLVTESYPSELVLKNYSNPVTLIHGSADDLVFPARSEALAAGLKNVDRIMFDGAGHAGGEMFETEFLNKLLADKLP